MGLPILQIPISSNVTIVQGDTIAKISCAFDADDNIDITDSTIKMQLHLGGVYVYTAVTGSGITHVDSKTFEIDEIQQTTPFPEGVLKGDVQITNTLGNTTTYFNVEVTVNKQHTV